MCAKSRAAVGYIRETENEWCLTNCKANSSKSETSVHIQTARPANYCQSRSVRSSVGSFVRLSVCFAAKNSIFLTLVHAVTMQELATRPSDGTAIGEYRYVCWDEMTTLWPHTDHHWPQWPPASTGLPPSRPRFWFRDDAGTKPIAQCDDIGTAFTRDGNWRSRKNYIYQVLWSAWLSMSVCLSVCLSGRSVLPVTVARSSSDSNALCYVFSVSVLDVVIFY